MIRRVAFGVLWVGFAAYAFLLAPPNAPDTASLLVHLATGQWNGINPLVIALFNIMGVLPLAYSSLLLVDGRGQRLPAWPFVLASFGVGAFMVLPYLALRQPNPTFTGEKNGLLKGLDSRWTGAAIALSAIGLILYGVTAGDWSNFVYQWQTSRFIHVMSLDFGLLCVLFPALIGDDMARRGIEDNRVLGAITLIPLFGALAYLALRPPLGQPVATSNTLPQS
ncbi:DUF2834 domain-containing protein [Oculatella sp. LEGE 06141]|uniref:DUF2834 domain-containing protein n=1 Tax=Oculatella sp. LEGE 06141 TaxID=1828648 RepID=UPI001880992E|nr:DUF2834 domain-containing protein [Oculatella sp. LEGE 06141]MBE9177094.1 DUF2834 domain-containing protein [Oculatella sp. LEGE 06141]